MVLIPKLSFPLLTLSCKHFVLANCPNGIVSYGEICYNEPIPIEKIGSVLSSRSSLRNYSQCSHLATRLE